MFDNLNHYKVFYTVAKAGNISKAAEQMYISQPAISKSISNLEKGLGVSLFVRSSKGVSLTDEGQVLYNHVKQAFASISQGEDELRRINELGIGQLRIGVSTSLCKHILLDALQDFIVAYPHIKVIIDCHSTVNTMRLLQEGSIDIGLICETDIPSGYKYQVVQDIHDIFVANQSYLDNLELREREEPSEQINPWLLVGNLTGVLPSDSTSKKANQNGTPSADQTSALSTRSILEKSNLMLLENNNITRTHIDTYLAEQGIHPNQVLEINNMDLLIDFAAIGMGISSVVREFATEYLESGQIVELALDSPIEKRTVGFVYADSRQKPKALQAFLSFYKNR